MNEREARLVYKNKITKNINLAAFIASCVVVYSSTLLSAFLLVANTNQVVAFIFFGLCVLALVMTAVRIGLMFVGRKDGFTIARFKAIDVVKQIIRGTVLAAHAFLAIGVGTNSSGMNLAIRVYSIFIAVIELILFVYGLWKMAWIKENPERIYGKFAIKEVNNSRAPVKNPGKTHSKYSEPAKIEETPKAIPVVDAEVKEIEVKK